MTSRSKRLVQTASFIALASGVTACGRQRGPTDTVDRVVTDTHAPQFILEPAADNIQSSSADLLFSVNEKAEGALIVRKDAALALTNAEVEGAPDKKPMSVKAFETTRLSVTQLEPDQTYQFFLTIKDLNGNTIGEPVIKEFKTARAVIASSLAGTPNIAREGVAWSFKPTGLPDDCALKIVHGPLWMKLSAGGAGVEGVPDLREQAQILFKLESIGEYCSGFGDFKIKVVGDPLFNVAWHMNPDASSSFSWFSGRQQSGINLASAINQGFTGAAITMTMIDSGMLINHPDLKHNINPAGNINLEPLLGVACQVCDATDTSPPLAPGEPGDQGTAVAGIIAAEGWNSIGSRGIAPSVKISAYNLTAPRFPDVSENDFLRIFAISSDIVCHSGTAKIKILTELPVFNFDTYDRAQKSKVSVGRSEKGIVYLKAAGDHDAAGGNAAFDQRNVTSWGMIIGSHNVLAVKSRKANTGANLWISGPGGEAGHQSNYDEMPGVKTVSDFYPGIVSTDIFNPEFPCSVGFAKRPQYFQPNVDPDPAIFNVGRSSGFNLGWHPLNQDCQYTATVANTPAATGVVAGAVALLLEAKPELTWRDIKHVLAKSARPIDLNRAPEITNIRGSFYQRSLPWITNAAGFKFHNAYGFGALDIGKALAIAQSPSFRSLPRQEDSNWILADSPVARIPPASIAGVFSDYFHVNDVLIESVQIRVNIAHAKAGNLGVELVSPNGTRSILKAVKDGARFPNLTDMIFLSNAFYGERSRGTWQLRVVDGKEVAQAGYLNSWSFRITGHKSGGELQL